MCWDQDSSPRQM
uniref:Uncharacterized protein n=1 Tax=Anguilla anguilla TaxID=7936 RepID=A0A0E9TFY9_ANGAN